MSALRIKKDDTVIVTAGKFRGQQGKVVRVLPADNQVVVEGINMVKRHRKPVTQRDPGGIIDLTKPIAISNVAVVDPSTGKPTKVAFDLVDGKKVRKSKSSGATL